MADISGYLQNIRNGARGEDVRDSIINALDKINKDNPSVVKPLNVTANGTYAGEGGVVYNPVTVNVPEGASQALGLVDLKVTENGEFEPDEGQAYRSVTVEVPEYVNEIMQDVKVIEYAGDDQAITYAYDDGYDGYAAVQVIAAGGGGGSLATFRVKFMSADGGTLLEEAVGVPYGGGAVYHKPTPTSPGMRFVGWSPNPINVKSDMVCKARFENAAPYDPNQILDDWVTIAKNCEADPDAYNIGQWKILELTGYNEGQPFPISEWDSNTREALSGNYDNTWYIDGPNTRLYMELVAKGVDAIEGENGYANTTWMVKMPSAIRLVRPQYATVENHGLNNKVGNNFTMPNSWPESPARAFLRGQFTSELFPKELIKYIKRVIKYTSTYDHVSAGMYDRNMHTIEWFFIPSAKEFLGGVDGITFDSAIELEGPSYYSNFTEADFKTKWATAYNTAYQYYGGQPGGTQTPTRSSWTGSQGYANGIIGWEPNSPYGTASTTINIGRLDDRGTKPFLFGFCI